MLYPLALVTLVIMIIRVFTFYVVYYGVFILNHGCPLSKWGDGVVHCPEGVDHCPRRVVHCPRGVVHYPERRVVMLWCLRPSFLLWFASPDAIFEM